MRHVNLVSHQANVSLTILNLLLLTDIAYKATIMNLLLLAVKMKKAIFMNFTKAFPPTLDNISLPKFKLSDLHKLCLTHDKVTP